MYKVYIELDSDNNIISINSELFLSQKEMENMTLIDEGEGDKFAHAQSQYLEKNLIDELGRYNYKFEDGTIKEIAEADKQQPTPTKTEPTEQEKINAQLMLQIAQLKAELKAVK